jgi:uncharacterized membrane protein YphA (DoxX/SURF4 family)
MKPRGFYSWHFGRVLLGVVFVYAGVLKGLDVETFAVQLAAYQILPTQGNIIVAAILPFVELIVGLHLVFNRWARASALVVFGLCGTYMVVLASVLLRGMAIDCGCFGPQDSSTPLQAIVRNLLLVAMAHFVFHLSHYYSPALPDAARDD